MIISFYNHKVDKRVVDWQKKVFDHFGIQIYQHYYGEHRYASGHATGIDEFLNGNDWKEIILMDIDCIPTRKNSFDEAREFIKTRTGIYGAAQKSSHIPDSPEYAAPSFICFNRDTYELLGKPSFLPTYVGEKPRGDVGAELTYAAKKKGVDVLLIYPTDVEKKEWPLDKGRWFGYGTTYADKIYHSFGGHWNTEMFVKKCKKVIGV